MPLWLGHLMAGLIGALVTGVGTLIFIVNRLSRVETRQDSLETLVAENRNHTDARIFEIQNVVKEVVQLCRDIIKQNDILIAEMRASLRRNGQ